LQRNPRDENEQDVLEIALKGVKWNEDQTSKLETKNSRFNKIAKCMHSSWITDHISNLKKYAMLESLAPRIEEVGYDPNTNFVVYIV
jgi:hypothetical protein